MVVYSGPGTDDESVLVTVKTFENLLGDQYSVRKIPHLLNNQWESRTALLIMPGGRDIPYGEILNGRGNDRIRSFIQAGGSYLGICAGAYYAGEALEFAKGEKSLEVIGKRELGLFQGLVKGPTFLPFDYSSPAGRKAVDIFWRPGLAEQKYTVFYKGGGHFVDADKKINTQVLATYADFKDQRAAIVKVTVGKGIALLSGIHFEYDAQFFKDQEHSQALFQKLKTSEALRLDLLENIRKELKL